MKALRELGVALLSIVLVILITGLGLIISVKDVVQTTLITETAKQFVKEEVKDTEASKEVEEAINEIVSYKGTQEVIDSFLNDISESKNGSIVISDKTYDLLIKMVEDNKEDLIKMGGEEEDINEFIEEIKRPERREELQKNIDEGISELNIDINNSNLNVITTYSSIAGPKTITKIGIAIGVIVALIALIMWSPYKWIRPTSISSIISGLNLIIIYLAIDSILKMVSNKETMSISIDTSNLKITSLSIFVGGIVALIIYIIINIIVKKAKNNNVVSDTSNQTQTFYNEETKQEDVVRPDVPIEEDSINPEKKDYE